jgi:hypothetical protein
MQMAAVRNEEKIHSTESQGIIAVRSGQESVAVLGKNTHFMIN